MAIRVAHLINHEIGLQVHARNYFSYLRKQGYEVHAVCQAGKYVQGDTVTEDGIPVKTIPFPPSYTPLTDLKSLLELRRYFREEQFDIVHTHTVKPGLLGRIAGWLAGVPIVIHTVHGFHIWDEMSGLEKELFLWLERFAALFSDLLLSQNREDIDMAVREYICPARRIHYLGNGIDISFFRPDRVQPEQTARMRRELGVAPDEALVGTIGRLVRLKGYYDFMEAARILQQRGERIKFVTIGLAQTDKADTLSPQELIAEYGLQDAMQHLGRRDDVRELIAAMDAVVLASYAEGIPRVLMEAAAMGKAAVGTDVRGTREVIIHGQTGYLVPAHAPDALADAISRLVRDRRRAETMGRAARRRAEAQFDERHYFWRTDLEYRRLLTEKGMSGKLETLRPLPAEALPILAADENLSFALDVVLGMARLQIG